MTTSATQALNYTRTVSPHFTSETSLGYIRSTPLFISPNKTQPAMMFADSLYEPFNSASGTATGSYRKSLPASAEFHRRTANVIR